VLRAIFAYAVSADFLSRSPCRHIKLADVKPLRRRLPISDQLAVLADELGPHALMMWIGVPTGLRWAEVAGLRVGSLDLLRGELRVVTAMGRSQERPSARSADCPTLGGMRSLATNSRYERVAGCSRGEDDGAEWTWLRCAADGRPAL
jgi:hypothetical protein